METFDAAGDVRPETSDDSPDVSIARGALAGALAAAVALGVGELLSAIGGPEQSLVGGVGTAFIDRFAGALKEFAVQVFGTNDKPALVIGIVVISLGIGAVLGIASRTRPAVGTIGFALFGLVGVLASTTDADASRTLGAVAALGAVVSGVVVLRVLLNVARARRPLASPTAKPKRDTPVDPAATRRAFFGWAGAASAFAVSTAALGKVAAGRSGAESARRALTLPKPATTATPGAVAPATGSGTGFGVEGLTPYIVPNRDFYRIDAALIVPQVEPQDWRLRVTGMVDHPFELTFAELIALPQVEEVVTLQCVSNEVGGDLVGNARWQGVPLQSLLDRAGVQTGATQIVGKSVDGWTGGFPTEVAGDGRVALVAVGMNGEPLPIIHGFPARLVIAGLYGYVSATKWLSEIHLTTWEGFDGYWVPRGWSKTGPIKTESRIDVPREGDDVVSGSTTIAGVAWAPNIGISKVEVQVDDDPWRVAQLSDVMTKNTWVQWVIDWHATSGDHTLRVRATDNTGTTQTQEIRPPDPDGATGWHTRVVTVT